MGETTAISWADHTFNPWIGCARVSPACDGCYAAALMGGEGNRFRRAEWGGPGKGVGTRDRTSASNWRLPIRWNKQAGKDGTRPYVFCASLADVFDNAVDPTWRADLFGLIRATPNLVWLLLTKRPGNIVKLYDQAMLDTEWCGGPFPRNAAIGCTVVTQEEADRDVPKLLAAKAALNPAFAFLSMEPLLGPVDLRHLFSHCPEHDHPSGFCFGPSPSRQFLDWVITGGETDQGKHKARPQHPDWFRTLRDQCSAAGVAYHHKQNGEWATATGGIREGDYVFIEQRDGRDVGSTVRRVGKKLSGRLLDGQIYDARPGLAA